MRCNYNTYAKLQLLPNDCKSPDVFNAHTCHFRLLFMFTSEHKTKWFKWLCPSIIISNMLWQPHYICDYSVFILVFLSMFLQCMGVCVCVCVIMPVCPSVMVSYSCIEASAFTRFFTTLLCFVSFVGLDVSYCSKVSLYFLSVFLCCLCLCAIFYCGPCCLNKINDDDDDDDDDDDSSVVRRTTVLVGVSTTTSW